MHRTTLCVCLLLFAASSAGCLVGEEEPPKEPDPDADERADSDAENRREERTQDDLFEDGGRDDAYT